MTEPREEDIKGLLDRAFGPEPPLALNREEIFRTGRRRVRNRRIAASGGVAASVVAVVVGAATLTNLVGGTSDEELTPAHGSSTAAVQPLPTTPAAAPPRPSLSIATTTSPPISIVIPGSHANELTARLADASPVPAGTMSYPGGDLTTAPLTFVFYREAFHAVADLVDARGAGSLKVEIGYAGAGDPLIGCEQSSANVSVSCVINRDNGYPMAVTTRKSAGGMTEYIVHAIRNDATSIVVTASNVASKNPNGKPTTAPSPLVDHAALQKLAANPRLTYR